MKKTVKIVVCIVMFFVALIGFDLFFNRGNTDMTVEMAEASYPTVSIKDGGKTINCMQGYRDEMNPAYLRDGITPLSEGRSLSIQINKYDCEVENIVYEVRSLDGERLVESTEITNYVERNDYITATFSVKDLIESNEEYTLIFILTNGKGEKLRYYSRMIQAYDYKAKEKLDFVFDFSEKTFSKGEDRDDIVVYLESDSTGDNTNYQSVNIHSSFNQITWDGLDITRVTQPVATIEELALQTACIRLEYVVSIPEGKVEHLYNVTEYFKVRYGTDRMYLLAYERKMNQMFAEGDSPFYGNKIVLGITNPEISLTESEDGNTLAFVNEGVLFSCNITENRCARVFGFYDDKDLDWRDINNEHDIKILNVDETGNISFMVYGYMNRGLHEGQVGIQVFSYNSVLNTIEEEIFIPYDKSFQMLKANVTQLSFLNKTNELFVYLEGTIYCVNLETKEYSVIVTGVTNQTFKVSDDNVMLVWQDGENVYDSDKLILMNLNTKNMSEITTDAGKKLLPLGFMGQDLIYGAAYSSDIVKDYAGNVTFPMYVLKIRSETGRILKTYQQEGIFIIGCNIDHNMITLSRMKKSDLGMGFEEISTDTILNNQEETDGKNSIEVVATQSFKKIVQIVLRNQIEGKTIKLMVPKEVLYEGVRDIVLESDYSRKYYYVYSKGQITGIYTNAGEAIREANENSGVVQNDSGEYVWFKGNLSIKNQIMAIQGTKMNENASSLAVCLDTILSFEGYAKSTQKYVNSGKSAVEILEQSMPDADVMDLTGCNLECMLYFLNRDIPVLALTQEGEAILLVGFNELNTVWMNPESGTVYKVGMNDSKKFFEENGNRFITYQKKE